MLFLPGIGQGQQQPKTFVVKPVRDFSLMSTGIVLYGSAAVVSRDPVLTYADLESLDSQMKLPWPDRYAKNRWSVHADHASTVVPYMMAGIVGLYPWLWKRQDEVSNNRWQQAQTLGLMYAEAWLIQAGVKDWLKEMVSRPRPFLLGHLLTDTEKIEQAGTDGMRSFPSGHASGAWMTASFLTTIAMLSRQGKKRTWLVPVVMGSAALTTTCLRYASGRHYPTDLAAGAFVGMLTGILVPVLHLQNHENRSKTVGFVPRISGGRCGLTLFAQGVFDSGRNNINIGMP